MIKDICILGLGYIGLPTAAMFASYGHNVIGVDINENVVNELNRGNIIIEEPNLRDLVNQVVYKGKLKGSITPMRSDVFIISVPTPINKNKEADLTYVISAAKSIVKYLSEGNIVVLESTSPVGTTEEIVKPILEESGLKVGKDILLGYSPERVIPGNILLELKKNDRTVGGADDQSAIEIKKVYETIVDGSIYLTDCKTAEMCKLMENTYRDVNIALVNELSLICEKIGVNVWDVVKYCNKHPRVNLHNPGPGVGGHCLAIDPWFIVSKDPDLAKIIKLSRETNDSIPYHIYNIIQKLLNRKDNKKITILGITYKSDTDDTRESPIIKLIDILVENNYVVEVYDPFINDFYLSKDSAVEASKGSDLIVLGVNHSEFKELPLDEIKIVMNGNLLLDTRNFIDEEEAIKLGFDYKLLGKM